MSADHCCDCSGCPVGKEGHEPEWCRGHAMEVAQALAHLLLCPACSIGSHRRQRWDGLMGWTDEEFEAWREKHRAPGGLLAPAKTRATGKRQQRKGRSIWETVDGTPSESGEARALASWLRANGVVFAHVPNQGHGDQPWRAMVLKAMGLEKGAPDYLVFTAPTVCPHPHPKRFENGDTLCDAIYLGTGKCALRARGIAIELKKAKGGTTTEAEEEFLKRLSGCGWLTFICHGAANAILQLQELGIGVRP